MPERTTPERRYLKAKWAALLPFGVTVEVREEVLPLQANRATIYRHTQQVAERLEGELGEEQVFFVEGCQRDWDRLPRPDGPLTVGIDGGYVHARDGDNRKAGRFELMALRADAQRYQQTLREEATDALDEAGSASAAAGASAGAERGPAADL